MLESTQRGTSESARSAQECRPEKNSGQRVVFQVSYVDLLLNADSKNGHGH